MSITIQVEHLSKIYKLGSIGTGNLQQDLHRWIARLKGQEDPFLKIGQRNSREEGGTGDVVYSLSDISFSIEKGTSVGIIGRNGAGKSTLLKVLSRITSPSAGRVSVRGRIASLLEVGTGFHPELSGKDNIYLNGSILGMRRSEIDRKLDEIIEFSGVGRYIDTPVKRYSSGMYVRLAFAVAAHLESEILIIDEVLAVVGELAAGRDGRGLADDAIAFEYQHFPVVVGHDPLAPLDRHGHVAAVVDRDEVDEGVGMAALLGGEPPVQQPINGHAQTGEFDGCRALTHFGRRLG